MSITETVLIFVGIPAAVMAVIYGLVYGGSAARGKRYRPGRPFASEPVWFLASTHASGGHDAGGHAGQSPAKPAVTGAAGSTALESGTASGAMPPAGSALAGSAPAGSAEEWPEVVRTGQTGGASDSW